MLSVLFLQCFVASSQFHFRNRKLLLFLCHKKLQPFLSPICFCFTFPDVSGGQFFFKNYFFPFSSVCRSFRIFWFPVLPFSLHSKVCIPIYRRLTDVASAHYAFSIFKSFVCFVNEWQ